jgi:hypothetical protein
MAPSPWTVGGLTRTGNTIDGSLACTANAPAPGDGGARYSRMFSAWCGRVPSDMMASAGLP